MWGYSVIRYGIAGLLIFSFLTVCVSFALVPLGRYLVVDMPPQKSDVIVVLSGAGGPRTQHAVSLYHQGVAPILLMTGGASYHVSEAHFMKDYAVSLGVPSENIMLEPRARSTYENVRFSLSILKEQNLRDVVVVTSKYHTRRSYQLFRQAWDGSMGDLVMVGAPDGVDYANWWNDYEMSQSVLTEWFKILYGVFFKPENR